ncbi:autotransporter domain-containing protein [Pelagibacteraceae bacterium]|nr:autotransporter domain-containing protein [Pelagibacteraceae bacterium]
MSKIIKIICFLAFASTSNLAYAVNIATNSDITFSFTEAVRLIDNTILTNENVGSLITLKNTDASGTNLSFTATVNSAKTIITINPTNNFTSGQIIYAYIGSTVEDFNDNVIPATSKTFTAEYLVADLTNPLDNEDFVGLLNAQTETAKRFIQQSTTSVLKRMEWLRRNKNENELSHQGVSVNFIDADFNNLSNTLQFSNFLNQSADLFSNNWAVWSEGNITLGEVDANGDSSLRDVKTNGITFGIDNKIDTNHILGLALRIGKDNVDVGSLGNALDTDTYSLSLYGTMPYDDKTYIDGTLGISLLDMNLTRNHASGTLTGSREGKQLFGSLVYSAALEENLIKITPYGRIDGGYTILSSFSDTGTVAAIKYDEQKITSAMISIGILVDDEIEISNLKLNRYGRLEYGKDISSSSDATVSYVAVPNTKYILSIDDEESNNIRAALGTDIETQYKWSYQFDYEVNYRSGSSHLNTFSAAAFYELGLDSIISLSLDSELSTHSIAKLELDTRLKNGWFLNGAYEMKDYKDLSNENILRLQAVRYF